MNTGVQIQGKIIPVNPLLLFQRISLLKKTQAELQSYLQYELSPVPLSILTENGPRTTAKSVFYEPVRQPSSRDIIFDGGFLSNFKLLDTDLYLAYFKCFPHCRYYRYPCCVRSKRKKKFNLASLPPTTAAAAQHTMRSYLRIQNWLNNYLSLTEWG